MFRVSKRTEYAMRVMLALALQPPEVRLPVSSIEAQMLIPRAFLNRIVADLGRGGLIHAYFGPKGGLLLAQSAEKISLRDIYEIIEGPIRISTCLESSCACPLGAGCVLRVHWCEVQTRMLAELANITLAQLALETRNTPAIPA